MGRKTCWRVGCLVALGLVLAAGPGSSAQGTSLPAREALPPLQRGPAEPDAPPVSPGNQREAATTGPAEAEGVVAAVPAWYTESVQVAEGFAEAGNRSLTLDTASHPHVVYGTDMLYYGRHDGTSWILDTVDAAAGTGAYAALALDGENRPHISYYDRIHQDLKYAYNDGTRWWIQVVDSAGDVGQWTSLALGAAGRPSISFYDALNGDLEYAHDDGTGWQTETVDSAGDVGLYTSLALDSLGHPHIGYWDRSNGTLKYASYDGTAWQIEAVDTGRGADGGYTSLALDAADRPHLSYYDGVQGDLRYAHYDGAAWLSTTVDISGNVGLYTSLALDAAGRPHIGSYDATNADLEHAFYDGAAWHVEVVDANGEVGHAPSVAVDPGGRVHVAYYDRTRQRLWYTHNSLWQIESVDSTASLAYTSLALDSAGFPHLGYCEFDTMYWHCLNLRYAYYDGTQWQTQIVDQAGYPGRWPSLALDDLDRAHISYYEEGNDCLRYAHSDASSWISETVDCTGSAIVGTALALDAADRPHIAYAVEVAGDLRYASYDGASWQIDVVEDGTGAGFPSLVLDAAGRPHVSYCQYTGYFCHGLRYAWYDGTAWITATVDPAGELGYFSSLALDAAGRPRVSYSYDGGASSELRYAYHDGTAWVTQTVATGGSDIFSSLALDSEDRPHIAYSHGQSRTLRDRALLPIGEAGIPAFPTPEDPAGPPGVAVAVPDTLEYAFHNGLSWQIEVVESDLGGGGTLPSLVLDAAGEPHLGYVDGNPVYGPTTLKYAHIDRRSWQTGAVAESLKASSCPALAVDAAGRPRVSFYDITYGDLRYAAQRDGAWQIEVVDPGVFPGVGDPGQRTSLALDPPGNPHISYYDAVNQDLKYAHDDGGDWTVETVDSAGDVGRYSSLALDAAGRPHISYDDATYAILKYAYYDGAAWQVETVPGAADGRYTSLALDGEGRPRISYLACGYLWCYLRYAAWHEDTGWEIVTVDAAEAGASSGSIGHDNSLALDAVGRPHISYAARYSDGYTVYGLKYAWFDGISWYSSTLASAADNEVARYTSLALDAAGRPRISYYHPAGELVYMQYDGSAWFSETVDSGPGIGLNSSLALDAVGSPHIVYSNDSHALKHAFRCSALEGVELRGPPALLVDQVGDYQAGPIPITASLPLEWAWQDGATGPVVTYSWPAIGTYTLAVTGTNRCGQGTASLAVRVLTEWPYSFYLPVLWEMRP